jgi:hypothetical protein
VLLGTMLPIVVAVDTVGPGRFLVGVVGWVLKGCWTAGEEMMGLAMMVRRRFDTGVVAAVEVEMDMPELAGEVGVSRSVVALRFFVAMMGSFAESSKRESIVILA